MKKFKEKGEGRLEPNEVQLMQEVYPDIKVLAGSGITNTLNVSCATCIREALHVFVSVFDRLANDPHVTEAKPATDGLGKADGVFDPVKEAEIEDAQRYEREHLTPEREETLLSYLGLTKEDTPHLYLEKLTDFMKDRAGDGKPADIFPDLEEKRVQLQQVIDSLPPVVIPKAEHTDEPPAVTGDKVTTGTVLNTPESTTEKQKAAETKAKTVVKNTEKVVKEQLGTGKTAAKTPKKAAK